VTNDDAFGSLHEDNAVPDLTVVRPTGPSPLERLVDDYLMACRAKGLSPNTVDNSYGYPLRHLFLPWCHEHGVSGLDGLDGRAVDAFSVFLIETPGQRGRILSRESVHSYVRAVRGFLNWCEREGEAVSARPSLPKLPRRILDVLDREEIRRLVAAAPTERDRLILSILADCGLRNTELCTLEITDIIRRDRQAFLRVHGKGARERLVPLPPALLRGLDRYERYTRPADTRSTRLFLSLRRARHGDYEPLTRSGVLQLVRSAAKRANLSKSVHAHLLRHSFVTNALRGGMNPMMVAQIVGHSSLRMIEQVYSHLNSGDAYEALITMLARP
jgi:site-specific recombinase XerD